MLDKFRKLSPTMRTWTVRGVIALMVVVIGIPLFKTVTKKHQFKEKSEYKVLDYDAKTFEKALFTKTEGEMERLRAEIKSLKDEIEDDRRKAAAMPIEKTAMNPASPKMDKMKTTIEDQLKASRKAQENAAKAQMFKPTLANVGPEIAAGVTDAVTEPKAGIKTISFEVSKKSDPKKGITLPPSFMDASLLTGVIAPTAEAAKGHPIPMLIRIKDLAVLPNEVKADLKGCFVIAEGEGKLAQERVEARLLNLSCITKTGDAIIDQKIEGWVVDADGKAGLSGRVVAKFGSHVARVAVAGFLEGFGEAFELSVSELSSNYWGQETRRLKDTSTGTLATAGAGRAIARSAETVQDFYLKLAEQTLPVIEVGPTKHITIIVSEGTELLIKERKQL
jgi:conjugal transfer pilus assembly protein TraB